MRRHLPLASLAVLIGGGLVGGCTTEGDEKDTTVQPRPADVCSDPAAEQDLGRPFEAKASGTPRIDAALSAYHRGRRYCLSSFVWDSPRGYRITSYTVDAPANAANYGQSFTTSDPDGSDELLNFPFEYHLSGPCSEVTATIVMTDRDGAEHAYVADAGLGRGC